MSYALLMDSIGEDWVEVTTAGNWDWEWDQVTVWYSPSARRFFWYSASGCSCNSYGDYFEPGDMVDGDRAAAINAVEGYGDGHKARAEVRDFAT